MEMYVIKTFHMKPLHLPFASMLLLSLYVNAQDPLVFSAAYRNDKDKHAIDRDGNTVNSNVPLNEISIHAFRHFHKMFPQASDEYWVKTGEGYIVSFMQNSFHNRAHFDLRGSFLCSLKY